MDRSSPGSAGQLLHDAARIGLASQVNLSDALWDSIPAALYVCAADGTIARFNNDAATLWGREPALADPGERFCGSLRLYERDGGPLPHAQSPMVEVLRSGEGVRDREIIIERPDRSRRRALVSIQPIKDRAGAIIGAVGCFQDITQHKQLEDELQSQQAYMRERSTLLQLIVEASDDAIVSKNLNGIITSWNRGAERLFGYTADEIVGKSILTVIPPDRHEEEERILGTLRRGERVEHYETVRIRKDGTLVDVSLSVSPILDDSGRAIGAAKIARDITERKEAQARQELLSREVHHRTRNLFAVVQAVVGRSFLQQASVREAQAAILSRLQSLAQTHTMLLDNEWRGADMGAVVSMEMRPYPGRISMKGPDLSLSARAAQNFALALHELATNAVKYGALSTPAGRVELTWGEADGGSRFFFRWQEIGGPPVKVPTRKGFGSSVLEHVMGDYADTPPLIAYEATGLIYEVSGPMDCITADESEADASGPVT